MSQAFSFPSLNLRYVLDLYERYQQDPFSVDQETRNIFQSWSPPDAQAEVVEKPFSPQQMPGLDKIVAATNLAQAVRTLGHLAADLDPLGSRPHGDPALTAANYGLGDQDLHQIPAWIVGGPIAENASDAFAAIQNLRGVYSSKVGYDYGHIRVPEERDWLRQAAECGLYRPPEVPVDLAAMLTRLTQVEVFEQFLHRFFPGKTRFSIEGLDMLVPILDETIQKATDVGICAILIGMAHRGRLNVLAHILSKPYSQILAEFKDPGKNYANLEGLGWTGDVKYHTGANVAIQEDETVQIVIGLPPNPSHLEHVNPILAGMARAADSGTNHGGPPDFFPSAVLPIIIHGDASFPGEGVVAETLNLSKLPGYQIAGTVHIIANNQLGFTTSAKQSRSTLYASDLAKGFEIPVLHVNADDPVACMEAARTAFAYREKFHKDFLIDLVGYRRYGHNEGDEPGFTQPLQYKKIEQHPSVRRLLAEALVSQGVIPSELPDQLIKERMEELQKIWDTFKPEEEISIPKNIPTSDDHAPLVKTSVSADVLRKINLELLSVPKAFALNHKLERAMQRRRSALEKMDESTIDWAMAEELAFATILLDGTPIRLTGQDVERGTYSQRHAVFHDSQTDALFIPLQSIAEAKATFEIHNSPLSENAALGFEYGYNIQSRDHLVIWEAQYGDFINAAQAIVDEFIVSGRAKWEQYPSLVMLLPHGYEGQGPDHSGGRIERFLRSAADNSLRIVNCTTAAQYFHVLRLQAALLIKQPLPMVIFTPKSLLRHPKVASTLKDLAEGEWSPVLDDPLASQRADQIHRVVLCSGKIGIDLLDSPERAENPSTAILRIEQLSPFPMETTAELLSRYPNASEFLWLQEEPENMGAWGYVRSRMAEMNGGKIVLKYFGRPASSSPSEGSFAWHSQNQQAIISQAFQADPQYQKAGVLVHKER